MAAYFDPVTTFASVGHIDHTDGQPQNSLLYLTQRFEIEIHDCTLGPLRRAQLSGRRFGLDVGPEIGAWVELGPGKPERLMTNDLVAVGVDGGYAITSPDDTKVVDEHDLATVEGSGC